MNLNSIFIAGVIAVALAFILHILIWRRCIPNEPTRFLILIFLFASGFVYCGAMYVFFIYGASFRSGLGLLSWTVGYSMFVGATVAAYICFYSAVDVDSPSLTVVRLIQESTSKSISESELRRRFESLGFVESRLRHMGTDNLTRTDQGLLSITPQGAMLIRLLDVYRNIVGRDPGLG